jgi:glycosyltransferase involved in cell wall biosynthesis
MQEATKMGSGAKLNYRLGMMYRPSFATPIVNGARIAVDEAQRDFLRFSRAVGIELFVSPVRVDEARAEIEASRRAFPDAKAVARVHSVRSLKEGLDRYEISVWHEAGSYPNQAVYARSTFARRMYPITFCHHSFSPQEWIHNWALHLLTLDIRACDSQVCTSRASRSAIQRLVARLAEDFNRTHGTKFAFNGRFDVIPLGVDVELFRPRDKTDVRRQLELPQNATILLWVGRLVPEAKADLLPLLLEFRELRARGGRDLLLVLGGTEGFYAQVLREYSRELGIADAVRVEAPLDPKTRH